MSLYWSMQALWLLRGRLADVEVKEGPAKQPLQMATGFLPRWPVNMVCISWMSISYRAGTPGQENLAAFQWQTAGTPYRYGVVPQTPFDIKLGSQRQGMARFEGV
jgi:hypothetical protein